MATPKITKDMFMSQREADELNSRYTWLEKKYSNPIFDVPWVFDNIRALENKFPPNESNNIHVQDNEGKQLPLAILGKDTKA